MEALAFLKQQHEEMKTLFEELERSEPTRRVELWQQVPPTLKAHELAELQHVYGPASLEAPADFELADWPADHDTDVAEVEDLLGTMESLDPASEEWVENLREIRATLIDHMAREEDEMWPEIRQVLGSDRLEQAGEAMRLQIEQQVRST